MSSLPSPTFCILPWVHLAATPSGQLRLCCVSEPTINVPHDENRQPYFAATEGDPERYWNSPFMRETRQAMLRGEQPEVCRRCYIEEESGSGRSPRLDHTRYYAALVDTAVAATEDDGSLPFKPVYVDLRLGNLCNLRCRMCSPSSSALLIEEWAAIRPDFSSKRLDALRNIDWFDQPGFLKNMDAILEHADQLYFTGGEPTLAQGHFDVLQRCIERGVAGRIKLKYTTNGTNIPKRLTDMWGQFAGVNLGVSVDGIGDLARYIRYPSNWKAVERSIRSFHQMSLENPKIEFSLTTAVQVYNATRLTEIFDFGLSMGKFPYLNLVHTPTWFCIRTLPPDMKEEVSDRLHGWWAENGARLPNPGRMLGKLDNAITFMMGEDRSDLLRDFFKHTQAMDDYRGDLRLDDVLPEIAALRAGL